MPILPTLVKNDNPKIEERMKREAAYIKRIDKSLIKDAFLKD